LIADQEYFSRRGIGGDQVLELPACLPLIVDRLESASPAVRDQFLRASFWLDRALAGWHDSISLSYVALVNAVETIVANGPGQRCELCGSSVPGATRRFKGCVEKYGGDEVATGRSELYDLRSKLVHGRLLFERDMPGTLRFDPSGLGQRDSWDAMHAIARRAIVNWFVDMTSPA
jgi:hypothetical protein